MAIYNRESDMRASVDAKRLTEFGSAAIECMFGYVLYSIFRNGILQGHIYPKLKGASSFQLQ